jgi:hypothetical protein
MFGQRGLHSRVGIQCPKRAVARGLNLAQERQCSVRQRSEEVRTCGSCRRIVEADPLRTRGSLALHVGRPDDRQPFFELTLMKREARAVPAQKIREDMVSPSPTSSFVYLEFFT